MRGLRGCRLPKLQPLFWARVDCTPARAHLSLARQGSRSPVVSVRRLLLIERWDARHGESWEGWLLYLQGQRGLALLILKMLLDLCVCEWGLCYWRYCYWQLFLFLPLTLGYIFLCFLLVSLNISDFSCCIFPSDFSIQRINSSTLGREENLRPVRDLSKYLVYSFPASPIPLCKLKANKQNWIARDNKWLALAW